MKKTFKKIFVLIVVIVSFGCSSAEEILNYDVRLELQKDSSVLVQEKIKYDFGNDSKHGIFRFIPNRFNVKGQKKLYGLMEREIEISDVEVFRDGNKETIEEQDKNDRNNNFFIKIGSGFVTIKGVHEYVIKYKVDGSLRYFNDFDEIYWNVTGNDWEVPIRSVSVELVSENNEIKFKNKYCYQGQNNTKEQCNVKNNIFTSKRNLVLGEGVTISASFDKKIVKKNEVWVWTTKGIWTLFFSILLTFLAYWIWMIRRYVNKFKRDVPVIPIYEPYKNYHPAITGYLIDKSFDSQDITAGILNLALNGYISIERIESKKFLWGKNIDYIFRLKKDIFDIEDVLDRKFIKFLFAKDEDWDFDKIMKSVELIRDLRGKYKNIENNVNEDEFEEFNIEYINEIKLSELVTQKSRLVIEKSNFDEWYKNYGLVNDFVEELKLGKKVWFLLIMFFLMFFAFLSGLIVVGVGIMVIYLVSFITMIFANLRYTKKGWEVKNNLEGFKWFLKMTLEERLKFFNSPEKNPQEFMEYLPYAAAFGVEKEWARQFDGLDIENPEWYSGNDGFSSSVFASEVSTLSESITSSVSSATTTSSGSFGGGSSGGGSGGGGGGSW